MNRAKIEGKVPFPVYALHRGGKHEKGEKIIADKSHELGDQWVIDFLWSTPELEKQFGGVKGLPSYYLVGPDGRVRAVIKATRRTRWRHSYGCKARFRREVNPINLQAAALFRCF